MSNEGSSETTRRSASASTRSRSVSIAGRRVATDDLIALGLLFVVIATSLFSAFRLQQLAGGNAEILREIRDIQRAHDRGAEQELLAFREELERALAAHDRRTQQELREHERRQEARARAILDAQANSDERGGEPRPAPSPSPRPSPSPTPSPSVTCLPNVPICVKE